MTRAELIKQQAISLIARNGFSSISLRHLARECGIQPGSVYVHYESKEALLQEIIHEYLQGFLLIWKRAKRMQRSPGASLRHFVKLYCAYILANMDSTMIAELDIRSLEEEGLGVALEFKRKIDAQLIEILNAGQQQRVFILQDCHGAAAAIISLVSGLCLRHRVHATLHDVALASQLQAFAASIVNERRDLPAIRKNDAIALTL